MYSSLQGQEAAGKRALWLLKAALPGICAVHSVQCLNLGCIDSGWGWQYQQIAQLLLGSQYNPPAAADPLVKR
jgi:hypothetical protein